MPDVPDAPQGDFPVGVERSLKPQEAKTLPSLEWVELMTVDIEASHRLACKSGGQCWVHELTAELEIPAKSQVELFAKLA
jgi:hypothetical protein